jgi:hypothetical protein
MKSLFLILCAIAICFSAYAATNTHTGVWTADLQDDRLQMTLFQSERENRRAGESWHNWGGDRFGFDAAFADLAGLSRADVTSDAANVKFVFTREAGTLTFDGRFSDGSGAGHFNFKPNAAFEESLGTLGFGDFKDDQMLIFTVHSLSLETVRGLQSLGYRPSNKELVEIAIFGITPDVVREYTKLGYPGLTLHELVEMRIGHVDAAFIQGMRDAGFANLSARQIAEAGILGVTPAWVRELRGAGVEMTQLREVTDLRVGHVTAKRVEEYRKAGYRDLTARQLSELGIQGVTPAYIEEMRKAGYDKLTVRQLLNAKIFGVTPDYIRKMNAAGYSGIPIEKLVQLKMAGAADILTKK